ncbi:MAG: hypothetical protein HYY23_17905 [Verrucomicrobia bacterium]|nr:hypothetical protein [Verrucomicrobiota bacterium]
MNVLPGTEEVPGATLLSSKLIEVCPTFNQTPPLLRLTGSRTRLRNRSCNTTLDLMSVTVNLSAEEVAKIKHFTEIESENEAVAKAAREFLRVAQLRELKTASGQVDYQDVSETVMTSTLATTAGTTLNSANT